MQDAAAISRTARVIDAQEQAERIEQLINDARMSLARAQPTRRAR